MRKTIKIIAVLVMAFVLTMKVYNKQDVNVSDLVLANMEALAEPRYELPEVEVVCSKSCNDGIGKCWKQRGEDPNDCERSPDLSNYCTCN